MIKGKKAGQADQAGNQLALPAENPLAAAQPSYLQRESPVESGGTSTPYIGHATRKTGSGGGSITWSQLEAAGCSEGEPYLVYGGEVYPLGGVACVMTEVVLVGQDIDPATYRVESEWRTNDLPEQDDGVRYAYRGVLLIPGSDAVERPPAVAMYTEDLHPAVGYASRVLQPLVDATRKSMKPDWAAANPTVANLPPSMRYVVVIGGTMSKAKGSGQMFVKRYGTVRPPTLEEIGSIMAAAQQLGNELIAAQAALLNIPFEGESGQDDEDPPI